MQKNFYLIPIVFIVLFSTCSKPKSNLSEFRGVWIATVNNIDWPQKDQHHVDSQKLAFIDLLDFYASHHYNAVIVQIRTAGDALYPTDLAPWSRFLTGKEGLPPEPYYDPVKFMIEACHQRGLEFHAWLNPYRATVNSDTTSLSDDHVFHQHPEWIIKYGNRYYLNPGVPDVRNHLVKIISEVCENYDIDGVHFDDYFYPYKEAEIIFQDSLAYLAYGQSTYSNIDDWRRNNVNLLIQELHNEIDKVKPGIPFGISPFGVWRNKDKDPRGSNTQTLQTNYDDLYADCLNWMEKGWIDYIAPQLYFSMDYQKAAYRELATWWSEEGERTKVPVYTGLGLYKVENNHDSAWYDLQEIPRQLAFNQQLYSIEGAIAFSAKSLRAKVSLAEQIRGDYYRFKRLPIVHSQLSNMTPVIDSITIEQDSVIIQFQNVDSFDVESIVVFEEEKPNEFTGVVQRIWNTGEKSFKFPTPVSRKPLVFAYLDQNRNLSSFTNPQFIGRPNIGE